MSSADRALVVGGGIAGLAASLRLAEHGIPVMLLERRKLLGGRASSHEMGSDSDRPAAAPVMVDNCQHVLMRCCVNLIDFYQRIGAADAIEFYNAFNFVDTQGRWSTLTGSRWLPAPLHLIPSLLRFRSMSAKDRLVIARGMLLLSRMKLPQLEDFNPTFSHWLKETGQTRGAVDCFWRPVVVSALNEEPDRLAAAYAFQLFRQAFLRNRRAFEMGLPRLHLAEIYSEIGRRSLAKMGVEIRCSEAVREIVCRDGHVEGVRLESGVVSSHRVVAALPHNLIRSIAGSLQETEPFKNVAAFDSSPITGIHLWFDRPVADCPHVALLGREMQWIFTRLEGKATSAPEAKGHKPDGSYLGLVVSASRDLTNLTQAQILSLATRAVNEVFPSSIRARILSSTVIREPHATFAPAPGIEALRPAAATPVQGLYLAGDWTRTGWPATMEGAVRSGYLAAEQLLGDLGHRVSLLAREMPADLLPRLMGL